VATDQPAIDFLTKFALVCQAGEFAPLSAFFGGFVAQELIKALTNKFMPVRQVFYTDCIELLPESAPKAESGLASLIGEDLAVKLADAKVFMVGCGAIGCELLKNFAMLNIGTGDGRITITDPDHIETSNLNRQFLFREKHIHKPKSQTAAAAVIHMNPALKGKIVARLDKVFEGSENVFTDRFFEQLTIVANALDNVQARRYVDRRCVSAKVPLLESGTLGPKGHV
jgi:molybdopterin/thiamine biosynthesis adenylyltransferase